MMELVGFEAMGTLVIWRRLAIDISSTAATQSEIRVREIFRLEGQLGWQAGLTCAAHRPGGRPSFAIGIPAVTTMRHEYN